MVGRISLALGLLVLLDSALGAQAATESTPRLRPPELVADGALVSLLPTVPLAARRSLPAGPHLRFDPFTREQSADRASAAPPLPARTALPRCAMPVRRVESILDSIPVATPDSGREYTILVAPPGCVAEPSR